MHYNDRKYTLGPVKIWLKEHRINVMSWFARSPDPSPIENLWAIVKKSLGAKKSRNKDEL